MTPEDQLENFIDAYGLATVLDKISMICGAKAEHLRHNWQDNLSAGPWDRMGGQLSNIAHMARARGLDRE